MTDSDVEDDVKIPATVKTPEAETAPPSDAATLVENATSVVPENVAAAGLDDVNSNIPEQKTSIVPDDVNSNIPENVVSAAPDDVNSNIPENVVSAAPDDVSSNIPENVASAAPDDVSPKTPEDITSAAPDDVSSKTPEDIISTAPENVSPKTPKQCLSDFPDDVTSSIPRLSPERSFRRVQPTASVALSLGIGFAALALLPLSLATMGMKSLGDENAKANGAKLTSSPVLPAASRVFPPQDLHLIELTAEVKRLEAESVAHQQKVQQELADQLKNRLAKDSKTLSKEIALARDARREAGKKGKDLSATFLPEELEHAGAALKVSLEDHRFLVDRNGKVLLPSGATLPVSDSFSWKSPGKNIGAAAHISDDKILAKACSYREKICLAQVQSLPALTLSQASSWVAALPALERRILSLEKEAPKPLAPTPVVDEKSAWLLLGGGWLLAAILFFFGIFSLRRQVTAPLQDLSSRLESVAHGHPLEAPKSAPHEYAVVHGSIDELARHVGSKSQLADEKSAQNGRLHEVSDALRSLSGGDTALRLEMQGDVAETHLRTAFNTLAEQVEARTLRLSSHLAQIQDSAKSTSTDAELLRKVAAIKPLAALLADISERLLHLADQPVQRQDLVRLSSAISQRGQAAEALVDSLEKSILRGASDGAPSPSFQIALNHLLQDLEELSTKKTLPVLLTAFHGLSKEELHERFSTPAALAPKNTSSSVSG